MSALKDLFGLELSLFLGRPAAPPELEGAIFGAPPSVMLGATKNKKMHADQNFDKVIKEAEKSGDPALVRGWLQRTSSLLAKSELGALEYSCTRNRTPRCPRLLGVR